MTGASNCIHCGKLTESMYDNKWQHRDCMNVDPELVSSIDIDLSPKTYGMAQPSQGNTATELDYEFRRTNRAERRAARKKR